MAQFTKKATEIGDALGKIGVTLQKFKRILRPRTMSARNLLKLCARLDRIAAQITALKTELIRECVCVDEEVPIEVGGTEVSTNTVPF